MDVKFCLSFKVLQIQENKTKNVPPCVVKPGAILLQKCYQLPVAHDPNELALLLRNVSVL